MAAQKRFHAPFVSERGVSYAVEIWDTAFSGSSTEFRLGEGGFKIHWSGESQERHAEILGSEASFVMHLIGDTLYAFLTDLISSAEGRFFLKITYTAGATYWTGIIVADNSRLPDEVNEQFQIKAVDGLGVLKSLDYKNGANAYNGDARIVEHIVNCLKKLSFVGDFYPSSTTLIKTSVDWWESTMGAVTSSTDPFYKAWVDHATFWDYDNHGFPKFLSCYDVLKHICTTFGCRIYYVEGSFWVEQITYRVAGSFYARKYDSTATLLGVDTATGTNNLDRTVNGAKLAGVSFEWYPALLYVQVEQLKYNRRNLLAGAVINQGTAQIQTYNQVDSNSSNSSLRFWANVKVDIKNLSYAGNVNDLIIIMYEMKIKVGGKSVSRGFTIFNFGIQWVAATWQSDSAFIWTYMKTDVWPTPAIGAPATHNEQVVQFITPPLESTGNLEFDYNFQGVYTAAGVQLDPLAFDIKFTLDNPRIEVYNFNAPDIDEDSMTFSAFNDDDTDTAHYKCETRIGDSTNPNTVGRLKVGPNSSSLTSASGWGAGSDSRTSIIGDLLALSILKGQLLPTTKMYGTVYGPFRLWRTYIDPQFRVWLMAGGTWSAQHDELDGEWFELLYGDGGVSITPVKRKYNPNWNVPPEAPTVPGTNGGVGTNSELSKLLPGTILLPVAETRLATAQSSGSISSIPVTDTLAALDFYIGDQLALYNPVTASFDTLTVTASSTTGATSIAVSGTLTQPYPAGSYIIKKPIIGHPSVFGHGTINKVPKWLFPNELTDSQIFDNGTGVTVGNTTVDVLFNVNGSAGMSINGGTNASYGSGLKFRNDSNAHISIGMKGAAWVLAQTSAGNGVWATPTDLILITSAGAVTISNLAGTGTRMVTATSTGLLGTAAIPTGTLTGTLTATRVPFASGATTLIDDATFTWDNTNKRLIIGTGTAQALINLYYGAVSGTQQTLRSSGNVNGNMVMSHLNASTSSSGNTIFQIASGSAAAGDPVIQFSISGVSDFAFGVDNSDGDKLKFTPNASLPGGVVNSGLCITNETIAKVGIDKDSPAYPLDVTGIIRSDAYCNASGSLSVQYFGGAGTGPSTGLLTGGSNHFIFTFTTGTAPAANTNIFQITLPSFFPTNVVATWSPANAQTATDYGKFYVNGSSQNSFVIKSNGTLTASTAYSFTFNVGAY